MSQQARKRKWNPEKFIQQQRSDFLSLAEEHPQGWYYSDVWPVAFRTFTKLFLKKQTFESYVDNLLKTCVDIASEQLPPSYFAWTLSFWANELGQRISRLADELRAEKAIKEYPSEVYKAGRKTIKPTIKKWVDAFNRIAELPVFDKMSFKEINLSFRPTQDLRQNLSHLDFKDIAQSLEKLTLEGKADISIGYEGDRVDFGRERIRITFKPQGQSEGYQLGISKWHFTRKKTLFEIKEAIITQSRESFGHNGYLVANILFGERWTEERKEKLRKKLRGQGRPADDFINHIIMDLDWRGVDRPSIGIFVDALLGRPTQRAKATDPQWSPRKGVYVVRSKYKTEKRIGKQIRLLGGNYLRYLADRSVIQDGLCERCMWGWNENGELDVAIRCAKHRETVHNPRTRIGREDWLTRLTAIRDEEYYANALTWRIREPNSERTKSKKND